MAATAAQLVQMNDKEAAVRQALEKAESAARGVSLSSTAWDLGAAFIPGLSSFSGALSTDAQEAAEANIRTARKRYEAWSDASGEQGHRRWAERGTEPDGYPYPVSHWLQEGDDLLSELGVHVKALDEGGNIAVVKNTVKQTGKDAREVFTLSGLPEFWPEDLKRKLKVGALVVGGVAVVSGAAWLAVKLAPVVTAVNSVRRKEEHTRG